ncbi:hypothetical protein BH23GEM6_BH23GEM6_22110 [soil metagenome]
MRSPGTAEAVPGLSSLATVIFAKDFEVSLFPAGPRDDEIPVDC